ncbi:MAG TPA: TraB/GumN family protein [Puia sp.]|nr:TraB/GumN family protein [Puia sp.]
MKLTLFPVLLFLHLASYAQPPAPIPHTLLWRISGKGLQKPSYLYGTMHLNDKRLFLFGDSLYHAIESSEGLAIEVNPDEMAAYFVNKMFDQMENGKSLEDVVGKEYFERHKKALTKKFNKPAEEISASDVFKEKNKWMTEYMRKGEMPTFMDAYLYNIARRQGKWLGGIEDIGDQAGLMEDLVDQSDVNYLLDPDDAGGAESSGLEKMIRLYTAQDLEGVEAMADDQSPEKKDKLLLHRNIKMARRMDSLSAIRSMVFAVGAAHLPGDSGVIDLLRRRGFTLEPVYSSKKIAATDYTFQEVHLPWTSVTDEQKAYTVEMPANPATVHVFGMVEMKFLMDLFNMSGYCTMAVVNPGRTGSRDSLFKNVAERVFHGEAPTSKNLVRNGVAGKEYIHYDSSWGNMRLQIFADSNRVYMVLLSAMKQDVLLSSDAEKFFQSFTITGVKAPVSTTSDVFTDSIMGVSFVTPVKLTHNDRLSKSNEASWKITAFSGIDRGSGAMVMLMSKELTRGYHVTDLPGTYDGMEKVLETQYTNVQKDSLYLQDSAKAMLYTGQNIQRPEIFISAVAVLKDGRQTVLMVISDSADKNSPGLREAIHSFRLIPHTAARWDTYEEAEHVFSFYGPAQAYADTYNGNKRWISFDTTTATSYMIIPDTLGKYAWYSSDSAFWKTILESDTAGEEVVEIKNVTNGDVAGKEYIIRHNGDNAACSRTRLLPSGNKLFKLYSFGELRLMKSPDVSRFFDAWRLTAPEPSTLLQSKAVLLFQDLSSKDSATSMEAYEAIRSAPFKEKDAPLLREALFKLYDPGHDTSLRTSANDAIARELAALNDSSSVDYVRAAYPGLVNEKQALRNAALSVLERQHTSYSYTALAELLRQGPTKERLDYVDIGQLKDSLALTAGIYPALLPWARDTLHASAVAAIAVALVDSGYLSKEALVSSSGVFLAAAKSLLPGLKANGDYNEFFISHLIELMGHLHTPAANALLKEYLSVKNIYLLSTTVTQLLKSQQPVSPAALRRLAADPSYRIDLYDDMKKYHRTALYPAEYLSQSSFALATLESAVAEEDEEYDSVAFVYKRTASYHGKPYVFYLYKVYFDLHTEEPHCYLGVAGGYDPAGGLKPKKELSGVYRKDEFDGQNAAAVLKTYLKWLDE